MTDDLITSMLGSPASAGLARTLTNERLHKWGYSCISDDAQTIVSELITNAAEATSREQLRFQLCRDTHGIVIAVWDSSPALPRPRSVVELTLDDLNLSPESFDENGGWGLSIIQTLASQWGYTEDPTGGKWIWARMNLTPPPEADNTTRPIRPS